jgi:VanZ family protein
MNFSPIAWRFGALAWALQIFLMSSSAKLSSEHTRSFLAVLWERWFGGEAPASLIWTLGMIVRKGAHMAEYGLLAFLVFKALEGAFSPQDRLRRASWSLGISVVYALSDEFHQLYVPGRGASLVDWGIDCTGALLAMVLVATLRAQEARTRGVQ